MKRTDTMNIHHHSDYLTLIKQYSHPKNDLSKRREVPSVTSILQEPLLNSSSLLCSSTNLPTALETGGPQMKILSPCSRVTKAETPGVGF